MLGTREERSEEQRASIQLGDRMCPLKSHRIDSPYRKCSRSLEDHGTPPEDCGGVRRHAAEPSRDPVAKKMLCVSITPFLFSGAQKDGSSLPLLATGM